ncbi:hypothetical protein [Ramlibacter sp.]|uniref:hypothetical protein n=1 Tax=Ramlibacter sp. TaxID=1917967 RepID=UPI002BED8B7C|nr:hypothetical protein [Ramlibacter sp.]HWI83487.1 hypothetical protein [Ramlibacter sp.]
MSSDGNFTTGTRFREQDRSFLVIEQGARNRVLRDLATQEVTTRSAAQLRKQYEAGAIEFLDLFSAPDAPHNTCDKALEKSLADCSEQARGEVKVKLHFLNGICPRGRVLFRRSEVHEAILKLHRELPDKLPDVARRSSPPSVSTFYAWRRAWVCSDFSARHLINRHDLRGRRPAPIPEGLVPVLERVIDEFYATGNRPSVSETLERAEAEVDRMNLVRPPVDQLPRPTRRQLQRLIDKADRFVTLQARFSTAYARKATRIFTRNNQPTRLLERVEIDHSPLDVICTADESGLVVGRPYLTVLIDVASRMIVGAWISFRPPNAATVLRALKHAILPKDELLKRYRIKGPWPARGVPSQIVLDNGKELHSNALEGAALDLGVSLVYCPPRQPFYKGVIERFLQEINYRFIHLLPGTTFAKYWLREDYDSLKNAVIPVEDLRRLVYRWIVEVYNKKFHRGIQTCPLEKWNERDGNVDHPVLPRRIEVLDVYLTATEERTLGSKGIEINSLHYAGAELNDLYCELSQRPASSRRLKVKPNADDLGFIHVLDPRTNTYFKAPCTWPEYANGLTQEQHEWCRALARERYEALQYRSALLASKQEMLDEARQMHERHQNLLALAEQEVQVPAKAKSKANKTPRASRSGVATQSRAEAAAAVRSEKPRREPAPSPVSFEGLEAFATGQSDLF